MIRALLADPDPQLLHRLTSALAAEAYLVETATDVASAVDATNRFRPDIIVLGLGLPDGAGVEAVRRIRGICGAPIVVLSAKRSRSIKIAALDAGADDYVTSPFDVGELLARLRSALRRGSGAARDGIIAAASFRVDLHARRVLTPAGEVRFTPTEWRLLAALASRPGVTISQQRLLEEVWGSGYASQTHYLRVYIAQLRRKLEPVPSVPRHFMTAHGTGYRFEP